MYALDSNKVLQKKYVKYLNALNPLSSGIELQQQLFLLIFDKLLLFFTLLVVAALVRVQNVVHLPEFACHKRPNNSIKKRITYTQCGKQFKANANQFN